MSPELINIYHFKFSVQDDFQLAQAAKNKGNKFFKAGKYDKSIECYTESIQICPADHREEIATFYQNRAAAYEQLVRIFELNKYYKLY